LNEIVVLFGFLHTSVILSEAVFQAKDFPLNRLNA